MRLQVLAVLAAALPLVVGCETKAKVDMTMHMKGSELFGGLGSEIAAIESSWSQPATPAPGPVFTPPPDVTPRAPGFSLAAEMAVPRGLHTATLMGDGRVLVVGGFAADGSGNAPLYVKESEVYDPLANTFTKTSDPSLGGPAGGYMVAGSSNAPAYVYRVLHAAVTLPDGRVLVCGGRGSEQLDAGGQPIDSDLATAHLFDPKTNTFRLTGSLKTARYGPRAIVLPSGKVLVVGGDRTALNAAQGGSTPAAEVFDPGTGVFTVSGDMGTPREFMGAAFVDGEALVVGGIANVVDATSGQLTATLPGGADAFDPSKGTFTAGPAPAYVRGGATLDAIGSFDAILAGGRGVNQADVAQVERFSNGAWSTVAQLTGPRERHASAASGADVLLAGGLSVGSSGAFTTLATADFFRGSTNAVQGFRMAHARNGCAVTTLRTGSFLVTGGFEGGTKSVYGVDGASVAPAEIFTKP